MTTDSCTGECQNSMLITLLEEVKEIKAILNPEPKTLEMYREEEKEKKRVQAYIVVDGLPNGKSIALLFIDNKIGEPVNIRRTSEYNNIAKPLSTAIYDVYHYLRANFQTQANIYIKGPSKDDTRAFIDFYDGHREQMPLVDDDLQGICQEVRELLSQYGGINFKQYGNDQLDRQFALTLDLHDIQSRVAKEMENASS